MVSTEKIKDLFEDFCMKHKVKGQHNIKKFIEDNMENIIKDRKRIDGSPNGIAIYINIKLKSKYSEELDE